MRIVVAPDKFAGTLTAIEAAEAMAEGWRRTAPGDELVLRAARPTAAPASSRCCTPGSAARSARSRSPARWRSGVRRAAARRRPGPATAYIEVALAAGLHLIDPAAARPPGRFVVRRR